MELTKDMSDNSIQQKELCEQCRYLEIILDEVRDDIEALLNSIKDLKRIKNILIECGVLKEKSASVLCIDDVEKKAAKVRKHFM